MSDTMLFGVLRMPYEMAMQSELSRRQFWERAQQAADEIENSRRAVRHESDCVEAAKAEIERLRAEVERLKVERDHARARLDLAIQMLTRIHGLLYPPPVTLPDGCTMVFRLEDLNANDVLQKLSDRIRAIPDELDAAMAQEQGR